MLGQAYCEGAASGTVSTREGQDRLPRRYRPVPVAQDES
jgi:hypothetical protein